MAAMTDIKQALAIGATGNIGRHAVRRLRDRGVAVRGGQLFRSSCPAALSGTAPA
jgi:nucleoside-diphosphate-sugar epimerase